MMYSVWSILMYPSNHFGIMEDLVAFGTGTVPKLLGIYVIHLFKVYFYLIYVRSNSNMFLP